MKIKWEWVAPFFPIVLATVIVFLLDVLGIIRFHISNEHVPTILLFVGLITTIIASSALLSREAVKQMRIISLKQAQEEYNAERSRFLRRLDHELKNPLTGIKLAINNLSETEDVALQQQLKQDIRAQVLRLSKLIGDLRKIADLGSRTLELQTIDLKQLLQEVYAQAQTEINSGERAIIFDVPDAFFVSPILGDPDLLLLAFYNLMDNALKYTQADDTITLRAFSQDDVIAVEVRDTGRGIAEGDLPYIWDELYRSEQVREIPGSGIGLALVKLIVERHNGRIDVQSQPGHGTTMRIYLPTMTSTEATARSARHAPNT